MKKLFLLIYVALLGSIGCSFAQVTGRLEFSAKDDYEGENIVPMEEKGLMVQSFAKDSKDGKRYFKMQFFSTSMQPVCTDSVLVDKRMYIHSNIFDDGVLYSVLRERSGEFAILAFDAKTHRVKMTEGEYAKKGSMRNIQIVNGHAVFSSTVKKLERVGIIDMKTGDCKYADIHFDGVKDKNVFILETQVIDGIVYAFVRAEREVYLSRIDMQGKQLGATLLTKDIEQELVSASISKVGSKYFVTGTYATKKVGSQGIYFGELADWKFSFLKFYNYLDLKHFTDYLSARAQKKIERKKEKKAKEGKEYTRNYFMASHKIMSDNKDYFYLGEAYYPTYRMVKVGTAWVQEFDGYAYTHAILVKFNPQGEVIWDNSVEMEPRTKPFYVKRFISASLSNAGAKMLFADKKRIVMKLFNNQSGEVIKERTEEVIETDNEDEKVKKGKYSDSSHWYGDNFLVYGTHVVKNTQTGDRRKVVYVNKYTIK
uniref:Uncharacterized protein n=3 Tax=unclassified Prevotella TaxID=2638335 RepID=A0AB33JRM5_9BACT